MRILYFGDYDPDYARNRVIIKGLRENGVDVVECNTQLSRRRKYRELRRKLRALDVDYDLMIVGYSSSRLLVPFAKLLSRKPVVWDAFVSIYDSYVFDRKLVSRWHPKAWFYWFSDFLASQFADTILLDTNQHIQYFVDTFYATRDKFIRVWIGANDEVFHL